MTQPHLPFPNLFIPEAHRLWFRMANAGTYDFKKAWFYPFKTRFLQKHALSDGYDLQVIVKTCHACDGKGNYTHDFSFRVERCWRCTNGVYDRAHIRLNRWDLCGEIYHCPDGRMTYYEMNAHRYRNLIRGFVRHEGDISSAQAFRAFLRLLLRYEPGTFWNLQTLRLKLAGSRLSYPLRRQWRALEIAMHNDACPEVDDIPF